MPRFHSFVVFAGMRTGSNFLESNLNALEGVTCAGEAFNPHFIGYPNREELLGISQAKRDSDPFVLLRQFRDHPDLCGFRYFHDHDPRILDHLLADEGCAKIFLKRDALHSYVSWKIARETGQWKLTDVRKRKPGTASFDREEFAGFVAAQSAFRREALRRLQVSGQPVFHLHYDDLTSVDVMNGLARFLGVESRLNKLESKLKVQNPEPISSKVRNPDEMNAALAVLSPRDPDDIPDVEIRRAASVPTYVLGARTPLVFMPLRGGVGQVVTHWMAALDAVDVGDLPTGLGQRAFRQWKRSHPGHRSFTVLRHPLIRAHQAFCRHILGPGPLVYKAIRRTLVNRYGLPIPAEDCLEGYDAAAHRAAFAAFLKFLQANLNGQTALRVDPAWCSQTQALRGFAGFALPDHILRENELPEVLPAIARRLGAEPPEFEWPQAEKTPFGLAEIYDDEIEALAQSAYQRDYVTFGFDAYL